MTSLLYLLGYYRQVFNLDQRPPAKRKAPNSLDVPLLHTPSPHKQEIALRASGPGATAKEAIPTIIGTLGTAKCTPRGLTAASIPTSSVPTNISQSGRKQYRESTGLVGVFKSRLHKVSENTASGSGLFVDAMRDDVHVGFVRSCRVNVPCVRFAEEAKEPSSCTVAYATYQSLSFVEGNACALTAYARNVRLILPVRALTLHSYACRHSQSPLVFAAGIAEIRRRSVPQAWGTASNMTGIGEARRRIKTCKEMD